MSLKTKIAVAILILFLILLIFIPGYSKLQKLKNIEQGLTEQEERLKIENAKLTKEEKRLKTDPFYIEKTARQSMKAGKKGELVYKITEEKPGE